MPGSDAPPEPLRMPLSTASCASPSPVPSELLHGLLSCHNKDTKLQSGITPTPTRMGICSEPGQWGHTGQPSNSSTTALQAVHYHRRLSHGCHLMYFTEVWRDAKANIRMLRTVSFKTLFAWTGPHPKEHSSIPERQRQGAEAAQNHRRETHQRTECWCSLGTLTQLHPPRPCPQSPVA